LHRQKLSVAVRISVKALERFKKEVRARTSRVRRITGGELLADLDTFVRGWAGYYARFEGCRGQLEKLDRWIRLRIRQWLWVSWKTTENRMRNLVRGGASRSISRIAVGTISPWRAASGQAIGICVTNERIKRGGLLPLLSHWQRFAAS
jgi:hypothetical protein